MTLTEYLTENKIKPYQFAKRVPIHHSIIYRFLRGDSMLSLQNAKLVIDATNGDVSMKSLLENGNSTQPADPQQGTGQA